MNLSDAVSSFYLSMTGVHSKATIKWYRLRLGTLTDFLGEIDVDEVTVDRLRAWRAGLANRTTRWDKHPYKRQEAGGLSMETLRGYVRAAKRLFNWMVDEGYIDVDPSRRLEMPPRPKRQVRGIRPADRNRMMALASECESVRDYAIMRVLSDTACRVGGLVNLQIADLDLDDRRAITREKGRGGQHVEKRLFFNPGTVAAIRAWLAVRPAVRDGAVFLGERKGGHRRYKKHWAPLTTCGVYRILERYGVQINADQYNPHAFRHGAIRGMLKNGMPLNIASQIAGHSSVQVTGDIYGFVNEEDLAGDHDRWGWLRD